MVPDDPHQGPAVAFYSDSENSTRIVSSLLGVSDDDIVISNDPGWMVRLLAPIDVSTDSNHVKRLKTTQEFAEFWEKECGNAMPVWWDADSF